MRIDFSKNRILAIDHPPKVGIGRCALKNQYEKTYFQIFSLCEVKKTLKKLKKVENLTFFACWFFL